MFLSFTFFLYIFLFLHIYLFIFFVLFQDLMCKEIGVNSATVERIRKLPNTKLRRDVEVRRLENYTELELVQNSLSDLAK